MEKVPVFVDLIFLLTLAASLFLFYRAANGSRKFLIIIGLWMILQGVLAGTGFYAASTSLPPRFALALAPPVVFIFILFMSKKGRAFIDSLNAKSLILLHVVRIPVELVLFWLFMYKAVPQVMTFEGRNFDILSGISAVAVYYFVRNRNVFLIWNLICLGLLINIVRIAILSTPYPFQQFGFDQPNIAVFHLPYIWLASVIVPMVLFAHLVCLRQIVDWRYLSFARIKRT